MAKTGPIISHWYKLVEEFQFSPNSFYEAVEVAIRRRQIPDVATSRVEWKEGGALTASRVYLRVTRGTLIFDICAAPFGTGFFFSWWLARAQFLWGVAAFLGLLFIALPWGALLFASTVMKMFGFLGGMTLVFLGIVVGVPGVLYLFTSFMNREHPGWDDPIMALPVVGPFYQVLFRPETYYKLDTALMFQETVRSAVEEVINGTLTTKGLRGLSELERKPTLKQFAA